MTKIALLCSMSIFALCAGEVCAGAANPTVAFRGGKVGQRTWASSGYAKLYSQNNYDAGMAIDSQNFSADFTEFTSAGADEFVIPSGHKWKIKEVDVTGVYYNGPGPASSESVLFYKDSNGLPGDLAEQCDDVVGTDNQGSFAIKIPKTCKLNLKGGSTYWLSVVANMDLDPYGQWGWETRTQQNGDPAAWENPNDGWSSGCTTWQVMSSCFDYGQGPDFMFTLRGKDVILSAEGQTKRAKS